MTTKEILKQLSSIVNAASFGSFKSLYYFKTNTFLKTFEQLVDAISTKLITPQDLWEASINGYEFTEEEEDFWLDNFELFDYNNYFPNEDKQIGNGKWIKVRTQTGYEIHFAKKSTRKRRLSDELVTELQKFNKLLQKYNVNDTSPENKLPKRNLRLSVIQKIGFQPYEVWYYRTKTQKAYITPAEYEIVDIDEFIDSALDKSLKGIISVNSLFTSRNADSVFYLQQRGISKERAMIMSNLQQCFFRVNMVKAIKEFNQQWESAKIQLG